MLVKMTTRPFLVICVAIFLGFGPSNAVSQEKTPKPFPEFEAKRLKPPSKGATKRIQVQIKERANPAVAPIHPQATDDSELSKAIAEAGITSATPTDWFWAELDDSLENMGPGRLDDALRLVTSSAAQSSLLSPRLQDLQDIVQRFGRDILIASVGTKVSPALALAVIYVESSGNPSAVSPAGAQGLMQLVPATAARFEVANALDAADNIKGGIRFLDTLMSKYNDDPIVVLAAYNAGEGAVRDHGGVPPFPETRLYVPKVLNAYKVARGLCITPPLLLSDGCVFAAMN